ncbi:hypothetical protein NQ176_g10490 [Zarea fungicola]|uniref:Uncharacterized protein n=1 Tax=Zarea fungicola TaxID=93591 RepID=A0ACC1MF96_9HYPO|nr:hypothetical protein NQ176_g10490 [Lecanicillium fungicola]
MKRVSEIRQRRERVFYKKRMAGKRERELATGPQARDADVDLEAEEEAATKAYKTKVFGQEKRRLRVRNDGEVEEDGMDMD